MKKIIFATASVILFASLALQAAPAQDGLEVFNEKDFPVEVELENYTHPYRWNKLDGEKVQFKEIWGYLVTNRLKDFDKSAPLTDLALFGVDIDCYGKLEFAPRRNLAAGFNGRVHLVAVCNSMSTTHFVLDPKYGLRSQLIKDLVSAAISFDGLQIDYELVPQKDGDHFLEFLRELKRKLNGKQLTVDYALSVLPANKYIIGVPFYGRSWTDRSLSQAWYFNGANRIMHENEVKQLKRKEGVPHFEYETKTKVTLWFDDATSLLQRARMYKDYGFDKIAFWRLGMEDAAFWEWITAYE